MTRDVVGGQQIHLGADVTGGRPSPRPEHGARLVIERIAIGRAPEEVLLERQGQVAERGHDQAPAGTDDVLPPDIVDVPQVRMGIRKELIEGADGPARPLVPTRIVELEVRRGDHCGIGSAYPSTVVSIHAAIFPWPTDPNWLAPSTSKSRGVWPILPTVLPPSSVD